MTVRDFIYLLTEYNMDAEIDVISKNYPAGWMLTYGGDEAVSKKNCSHVSIYLDDCSDEQEG